MENSQSPKKRLKVLIVEDEEDSKNIFKMLLETNTDYIVDSASNGEEALQKQEKEKFDVILLDIIMQVMDGVQTLKNIKENPDKYDNPIVLILTNLTGENSEESVKKYNADGYIVKIETEPEQLIAEIEKAVKQRQSGETPSLDFQSKSL